MVDDFKTIPPSNKGKVVWNDGEKNKMAFEQPGPEWVRGKIKLDTLEKNSPSTTAVIKEPFVSVGSAVLNQTQTQPQRSLNVFKISEHAIVPKYQTQFSAGFDIHACLKGLSHIKSYNLNNREINTEIKKMPSNNNNEFFVALPGIRYLVPTGLIFDITKPYQFLDVRARSGMAIKQGIVLANSTGVIDYDYVDELFVALFNISDTSVIINHGDRVAQGVMVDISSQSITEVSERPLPKSDRKGGIGSTGV